MNVLSVCALYLYFASFFPVDFLFFTCPILSSVTFLSFTLVFFHQLIYYYLPSILKSVFIYRNFHLPYTSSSRAPTQAGCLVSPEFYTRLLFLILA